jgi:hypothetical protein
LRATRRAHEEVGVAPEYADAQRALLFAVSWIARWEAFEHGYPADRVAERLAAIEPPTTGEGRTPQILGSAAYLTRSATGHRYLTLTTQLANLPDRGRSDWGADMTQAWVDATREFGTTLPPFAVALGRSGNLRVDLEPDPMPDADDVARVLRRAVEIADERYRERRDRAEERERQRDALAQAIQGRIDSAGAHDIFSSVAVETHVRHDGEHFAVALTVVTDDPFQDLFIAADIFRDAGGALANAGLNESRLELDVAQLDPDTAERLNRAVTRTRDELRRQRSARDAAAARYRDFAAELERQLGSPPRSE